MALVNREGIKVEGHIGTWYVIEETTMYGKDYYLLEHETYGEDAPAIAIREDGSLVLEDIYDGIGEVIDYLYENPSKA